MSTESQGQSGQRKPRIVPIYVPGSALPHLEWVNEPRSPRDWGAFVDDTYLPHTWDVDADSSESVEKWRRASATYMDELDKLRAEWIAYEDAVEAARLSVSDAQLAEHPKISDLFDGYAAEIAENRETLAAFAQMMQEEIDDIEGWVEEAREADE